MMHGTICVCYRPSPSRIDDDPKFREGQYYGYGEGHYEGTSYGLTLDDNEAFRRGRAEGRREMLWLMAVGAECESVLSTFVGDWMDPTTRYYLWVTMHAVSCDALGALRDLGDEQARRILEEA